MFLARIALSLALTLTAFVPAGKVAADGFRLPDLTDYGTKPWVIETLKQKVDYKFRGYTKTKIFLVEVIHPRERLDSKRDETHTVAGKWCHAKAELDILLPFLQERLAQDRFGLSRCWWVRGE